MSWPALLVAQAMPGITSMHKKAWNSDLLDFQIENHLEQIISLGQTTSIQGGGGADDRMNSHKATD